jgi:hypothetical protein
MKSDRSYGTPVRVERSNPHLVAKVAKVREALFNEEAAQRMAIAASEKLMEARKIYQAAEAAYTAAVAARKEAERDEGNG